MALGTDANHPSSSPATTTIINTSAFLPTPTSNPPGTFLSGGASPPLIIGFASIGAFAIAVITMCAWSRYMGRNVVPERFDRFVPVRFRGRGQGQQFWEEEGQGQGRVVHHRGRRRWRLGQQQGQGHGRTLAGGETGKPEMFDAWIERRRRTVDTLKWEEAETLPFSATLFTAGPSGPVETTACIAEVSSRAAGVGSMDEEEEDEEKRSLRMREDRTAGGSTMQVAVLLQMPSPPIPSHTVITEARNDISVRGELAIGLVAIPWTREHPSSHQGTTSP